MNVYKISAVTIFVSDMSKSFNFYSRIPGFRIQFKKDTFVSFVLTNTPMSNNRNSKSGGNMPRTYLNIQLMKREIESANPPSVNDNRDEYAVVEHTDATYRFGGRIIFYVENVDALYSYFLEDFLISNSIHLERPPADAPWGERYFHVTDPDGHQLSFAEPS
jgi:catechol 2,3-dioxygenase-like lactoylglutathione lyase family enzyme